MEIVERRLEEIPILAVSGKLVAGESVSRLREKVSEMSKAGENRIILEMEDVPYVDSSGLGMLVHCYTTLERLGGGLRLVNLSTRNLELLVLTKLSTVFQLYDDEQEAVNSFFPERQSRKFDILSFVESRKKGQ